MPKARRLPSGNYRALAYDRTVDGTRKYKSFTAATRKEAEFQAAEFEYKKKKARAANSAENLTFKAASDKYIADRANLSPSTLWGYRIIQRNAVPLLLPKKLGEIVADNLVQCQMNENAKKYSAKSLRNQYGFISAVFGHFKIHIDKATLKPRENKKPLVPSERDVKKIIQLLRTAPDIECQALLALMCSLRQSEIAGLHVRDIDGNVVHIHGARVPGLNGKLVYKSTTKSAAGTRTVVMPDYLAGRMCEACKGRGEDDYIFTLPPVGVLARFHKLLRRNGLPPYTIHSLRHAFAAIMHAQGIPDKYVMRAGGWSSDYVLKDIYQYTFDSEAAKAEEKANKYFSRIVDATRNATRNKKV